MEVPDRVTRPYKNTIMTFEYGTFTYHIWFNREIHNFEKVKREDLKHGTRLGETRCYIGILDELSTNAGQGESIKSPPKPVYRIIAYGKSVCIAPDQFNKETGRLIALRRAITELDDPKLKGEVFKSYLGRRDHE